jgi:hypothetical protein
MPGHRAHLSKHRRFVRTGAQSLHNSTRV